MRARFSIGDKVMVTFPRTQTEEVNQIGVMKEWRGKTFEGTVDRYSDVRRDSNIIRVRLSVEFMGVPTITWWCHDKWINFLGGPW